MNQEYDFTYKTELGEEVDICIYYEYIEPDPYSVYSDWDYTGNFFFDIISITQKGKDFTGEITEQEIARELLYRLREKDIETLLYDNEGF